MKLTIEQEEKLEEFHKKERLVQDELLKGSDIKIVISLDTQIKVLKGFIGDICSKCPSICEEKCNIMEVADDIIENLENKSKKE
jgi:hypothetical protein